MPNMKSQYGYTTTTYEVSKKAVELIRSLFAPGIGERSSELFDTRHTNENFDPENYDDISDYVDSWDANQWPSKTEFENVYHMVIACEHRCSTELIQRVQYILMRIYNEVFNGFKDTYCKSDRYDCIMWIVNNKILEELRKKIASEKSHKVTLVYAVPEREDEEESDDEDN
jgi:hypothetical protein